MKNKFASGFNVEADITSVNNSDSMVTLEGRNKSKMGALLGSNEGSTAIIDRNSLVISQQNMEPDEINTSDWVQMIQTKAEKIDLERIQEIKANKSDVEHQMKAIDIMHRQMTHLSILLTEMQKQIINEQNESAAAVNTKRLFVLE